MLCKKDGIERQTDARQSQLDGVAEQSRPVRLQRAVDDELQQAEDPAEGVEEHLSVRPADGGFAAVI